MTYRLLNHVTLSLIPKLEALTSLLKIRIFSASIDSFIIIYREVIIHSFQITSPDNRVLYWHLFKSSKLFHSSECPHSLPQPENEAPLSW